jgi:hypothetical protein
MINKPSPLSSNNFSLVGERFGREEATISDIIRRIRENQDLYILLFTRILIPASIFFSSVRRLSASSSLYRRNPISVQKMQTMYWYLDA